MAYAASSSFNGTPHTGHLKVQPVGTPGRPGFAGCYADQQITVHFLHSYMYGALVYRLKEEICTTLYSLFLKHECSPTKSKWFLAVLYNWLHILSIRLQSTSLRFTSPRFFSSYTNYVFLFVKIKIGSNVYLKIGWWRVEWWRVEWRSGGEWGCAEWGGVEWGSWEWSVESGGEWGGGEWNGGGEGGGIIIVDPWTADSWAATICTTGKCQE